MSNPTPPALPSRRAAFAYWLKLGCISFGGPAGQIALMHAELVERRRWISQARFVHALNYCMLLPGPEAQQLATYMGWLMHRGWGGVVAGTLFVLPSLLLLIGLSWLYMAWGQQPLVAGLFLGIKPAVTALVLQAAWRLGSRTLRGRGLWAIALAAFLAVWWLRLPFPLIVLLAAVAGALGARWAPRHFLLSSQATMPGAEPVVLAPHQRWRPRRALALLVLFLALWALPMGALWWGLGGEALLTRMAWFFSKAALLSFGGAYAVLPYVHQTAVEQQHWLSAAQMMDGLALGESTPGPLIMVVAFVAFVGGWSHAPFGPDAQALAGVAAALLVCYFTFLPSFLFILVGAPLVEATHGRLGFVAPLAGVSAAVVGVMINLALFFALHVLWPGGPAAGLDPLALLMMAAAALALLRYGVGVIPLLLASAALGLLRVLL
jgi:chromate transporter